MAPKKDKDIIKELKAKITALSKDPEGTKKLLNSLVREQKRQCEMNKELDIPISEVKESLDLGACELKRTIRGILFTAKGGMSVWVENRMTKPYQMLNNIFAMHEEGSEEAESYITACSYICQAPIFASLSITSLFDIATTILRTFNEYAEENYNDTDVTPETEEDIMQNNEADTIAEGLEQIVKS